MPDYVACRLPDSDIERFLAEDCPYGDLTTALLGIGSAAWTHHLHHPSRDRGLLHGGSGPAVREPGMRRPAAAADGRGRRRGGGVAGGLRAGRRAAHGLEGGAQHPRGGVRHSHAHPRPGAGRALRRAGHRGRGHAQDLPGDQGDRHQGRLRRGRAAAPAGPVRERLGVRPAHGLHRRAGGALGAVARDQGAGQGEEDRRGGDGRGGRPAGGRRRRRHHPGGQVGARTRWRRW